MSLVRINAIRFKVARDGRIDDLNPGRRRSDPREPSRICLTSNGVLSAWAAARVAGKAGRQRRETGVSFARVISEA
jgi:hypothetical protein